MARAPTLGGWEASSDATGQMVLKPGLVTPMHFVYADNVGVLGASRAHVVQSLDEVVTYLTRVGLLTHEKEVFEEAADVLGVLE